MSIINFPSSINLKNLHWQQSVSEQVNRSPWNGHTRIVKLGAAERWSASGEWPTTKASDALALRAFAMQAKGRLNSFRLKATEANQHIYSLTAQVNGAGASGYSLPLKGLPLSSLLIPAGSLITVTLPSGDEQLIGLTADLLTDGSGHATAALATVLRESPADGASVETQRPWGLMRLTTGIDWTANPGRVYEHPFACEEAF